MTPNEVFYLIDQHLEAEYDFANARDLADLQTQVEILSGQVVTQAKQISGLTNDRNEMLKLISMLAEKQGIEVRVEL
jgi:hypothetical protein